jgi:hypothetical protein
MMALRVRALSLPVGALCLALFGCDNPLPATSLPAAPSGSRAGSAAPAAPITPVVTAGSSGGATTPPAVVPPVVAAAGSAGAHAGAGAAGSGGSPSVAAAGRTASAGAGGAVAEGSAGAAGGAAGSGDIDLGIPGFPPIAGSDAPPTGGGTTSPDSAMCQDLACFDFFDCAIFHPEEAQVCNFTECVDFICK